MIAPTVCLSKPTPSLSSHLALAPISHLDQLPQPPRPVLPILSHSLQAAYAVTRMTFLKLRTFYRLFTASPGNVQTPSLGVPGIHCFLPIPLHSLTLQDFFLPRCTEVLTPVQTKHTFTRLCFCLSCFLCLAFSSAS